MIGVERAMLMRISAIDEEQRRFGERAKLWRRREAEMQRGGGGSVFVVVGAGGCRHRGGESQLGDFEGRNERSIGELLFDELVGGNGFGYVLRVDK